MSQSPITPAGLANDGIVYALAEACCTSMREVVAAATPERFIHLIAQQVAASANELSAELVAERLRDTAAAGKVLAAELEWAGREGRA